MPVFLYQIFGHFLNNHNENELFFTWLLQLPQSPSRVTSVPMATAAYQRETQVWPPQTIGYNAKTYF